MKKLLVWILVLSLGMFALAGSSQSVTPTGPVKVPIGTDGVQYWGG